MNKQDLALSLIRAPWLSRLTDRSFLFAVITIVLALYLQNTGKITGEQFINFVQWIGGAWILGEKGKDAIVANAALQPSSPTIAAGGDVITDEPESETKGGGE